MSLLSFEASSAPLLLQREAQSISTLVRRIPRRVVQFWDREPPDQIHRLIERNRTLCAGVGAEHLLFDEALARDFLQRRAEPRHLEAFDAAVHPAMKCDVFRLAWLAREGGFYVDADLVLRPNLGELLDLPGGLVVFQWDKQGLSNLCNWLIAGAAGQPVLEAALEATTASVLRHCRQDPQRALKNILNVSGPGVFTQAVATALAQGAARPDPDVNVQTVSRAHQLIELGPTYLGQPLDYKRTEGDQRHWRAAGQAAGSAGVPPPATAAVATGLGGRLAGWLTGRRTPPPEAPAPEAPLAAPAAVAAGWPAQVTVRDQGQRNRIEVSPDLQGPLSITIHGDDNLVRIGAGCRSQNLRIDVRGRHCEVVVAERCVLAGEFTQRDDRTRLHIGAQTTMMGSKITMHESGLIRIGRDCMLAGDVRMDTSDMHSILDADSGARLNPAGDIEIGDHVWLGYGVYLLKGVRVGEHSVVGACAVVADDVPAGCLAVGLPARVVRERITWDRRRLGPDGQPKAA